MPDLPTTAFALGDLAAPVGARLDSWDEQDFGARIWARDHTLWSEDRIPELADRLGWLWLPEERGQVADLEAFAADVRDEVERVVLLGMGGSSLAPEVFQSTFGNAAGHPELVVLDSTHPEAVAAVAGGLDLLRTIFVVASKSGGTIETLSLFRYFWGEVAASTDRPGERFVALTDPGSGLEALATERRFRRVFATPPDVGGRYSALTAFGLLPAALIGMDVRRLRSSAARMAGACGPAVPASLNPGLRLGAVMGEAALAGRDKLTYLCSPALAAFGGWVEQLIAESTGKNGTGIVPVAGEPVGRPTAYGDDRLFVHLSLAGEGGSRRSVLLDALREAGHPVVTIVFEDLYDLGAELFRSEMAVAAAGSVLGINPFDQPDVQIAKDMARRAMSSIGESAAVDEVSTGETAATARRLADWIGKLRGGDYIVVQADLPMAGPAAAALEELVRALRHRFRAAITLGYGPRFLHSTGQLHKGGANNGLFLQIVDAGGPDLEVPEAGFTFRRLIEGQSAGDYRALVARGRRVLRVRLGDDPLQSLGAILALVGAWPRAGDR